eukprot:370220-Ditylum_brightwellii.AAC.1
MDEGMLQIQDGYPVYGVKILLKLPARGWLWISSMPICAKQEALTMKPTKNRSELKLVETRLDSSLSPESYVSPI